MGPNDVSGSDGSDRVLCRSAGPSHIECCRWFDSRARQSFAPQFGTVVKSRRRCRGTYLSLEGNLLTRARSTASPKPTIGLTRCELSLNEWTYPPYSEVVQQTYNGPDGLYALLYYRFASDLTAAAYVKATTNVGKYCSSVPSSGVAAWDNGIPNTVGFSRTKNSTEQLTFFRQGKIVAGVDGASQELTTKLLQLQIRTIAAVK